MAERTDPPATEINSQLQILIQNNFKFQSILIFRLEMDKLVNDQISNSIPIFLAYEPNCGRLENARLLLIWCYFKNEELNLLLSY